MVFLFNELRKHGKLAAKRHPMYDKNRFGKYLMYIGVIFWAGYLVFFGSMFAFAFDTNNLEPYQIMNGGLILVLALDFLVRIPFQKTPTQEVKPYLLMPVKRNRIIDFLLVRSGLDGYNLFWLFMFVPFAFLTVMKFYGFLGVFTYCLGIWWLMIFNNYWFLLCRTLFSESIAWIALPLAVYGALAAGIFIPDKSEVVNFFVTMGEGFITGNIFVFLALLASIVAMGFINRGVMAGLIYKELNKVEDTKVNASEYKFFERWGEVGEYMRLELKMLLRNKACKISLRTIILVVLAFSCLLSFTEVYDGSGMKNFIIVYNFAIFGVMFVLHIMSYEGNYIDGLMSRKESIYTLLRAKYILYSIAIIIPFILMIPAMATGKVGVLTSFSWAVFTCGFMYFCLFQLAVYNKRTIPLNSKLSGRQNTGSALQNIISAAALGCPLIFFVVLKLCFGETITAWILMAIGTGFIVTSPLWLKNIYVRFMKQRYSNMEGFRDSRER